MSPLRIFSCSSEIVASLNSKDEFILVLFCAEMFAVIAAALVTAVTLAS
jgi:hypothetical protein